MAQFPVHGKVPRTKQRHYFFALVLDSLFVLHTEVIDSNDGLRIRNVPPKLLIEIDEVLNIFDALNPRIGFEVDGVQIARVRLLQQLSKQLG